MEGRKHKPSELLCPEVNCELAFLRYTHLREHLSSVHEIKVEYEELTFSSMNDFNTWLCSVERDTCTKYVRRRSAKSLQFGYKSMKLYCHRSFGRRLKDNRVRALKSQGSKKIGKSCPSIIEVVSKRDVYAKFWKTHCGHDDNVKHMSLHKQTREEIAKKLKDGVTFNQIINEVQDGTSTIASSKRLMLLSKHDLYNIVRDYNIKYLKKVDESDAENVEISINEVNSLGSKDITVLNNNEVVVRESECESLIKEGLKELRTDETEVLGLENNTVSNNNNNVKGGKPEFERLKKKVDMLCSLIETNYENSSLNVCDNLLNEVENEVDIAISTAKAANSSQESLVSKRQYNMDINIQKQNVMVKRKKNTKKCPNPIKVNRKPSAIIKALSENESLCMHIENDHDYI